jgi:trehalose/maltose transport system permease protein
MIVLMLIVAVWPLARSIWFSFTDTNINDISAGQWVGLENYFGEYGLFFNPNDEEGFWSGDWGISIRNTFGFAVVSVVCTGAHCCAGALGDPDHRVGQDVGLDAQ